jgi:hypothetical protein
MRLLVAVSEYGIHPIRLLKSTKAKSVLSFKKRKPKK